MNIVSLDRIRPLVVTKVAGLLALVTVAIAFFVFPMFSLANPAMCGLEQINNATFVKFLKLDPHSPPGQYDYITTDTNPGGSTLVGQLVLVNVNGSNMPAVISSVMGNTAKGFTNSAGTSANGFSLKFTIPTTLPSSTKESTKATPTIAVFSSFLEKTTSGSNDPYAYTSSGTTNYGGPTLVGQWILVTINGQTVPVVLSGKVMNGTARGLNPASTDPNGISLKITNIPAAPPVNSSQASTNW